MADMSEREKLAERIAAAPLYNARELSARELYRVDNESVGSREQKVFLVAEESRDLIITALRSAQDLPSEEEIARLRKQFELALNGHTKYSRDCCVSGEYLTDQVWPLVLSLLRTRSPSAEGWRTMRIYELVDVINAGERLGARINGRFVLDRDKVLAFLAQTLLSDEATK